MLMRRRGRWLSRKVLVFDTSYFLLSFLVKNTVMYRILDVTMPRQSLPQDSLHWLDKLRSS